MINEDEWPPSGIWRAVGPDGSVWAEASCEKEVRSRMREGDRLFQSFQLVREEWREVK